MVKNVPGEDIFDLDKIILPINMGNMHWIVAVIFMRKKRIEIFDSFGSTGIRYLHTLFCYIQDEYQDKKQTPLPDIKGWKLISMQWKTPRQSNGMIDIICDIICCLLNITPPFLFYLNDPLLYNSS